MYDPFHPYDREVIEFFNTLTYLGGKAKTCFIRGPMNLGDGKDSHRIWVDPPNPSAESIRLAIHWIRA